MATTVPAARPAAHTVLQAPPRAVVSGCGGSVRCYGRVVGGAGADAGRRGVALAGGGHVGAGGREAEGRHVAVDGLVLPGPDPERLVPDPDLARVPDGAVELPPRLQVGQVLIPGEPVQGIEVAPVLDHDGRPPEPLLEAQATQFRMPAQYPHHLGHGPRDRQPLADPQRVVEAHPDQEDDEIAVDVCRVTTWPDLHSRFLSLGAVIPISMDQPAGSRHVASPRAR